MTIGKGSLVLDAAWGWPDLAKAKADGYVGIIGYLSDSSSKNLSPARVKQARTLGMSINAVWEDGASDFATWTLAECTKAGQTAAAQKKQLGLPAVLPVFCAVDFNAQAAQYPKIAANIAAFAKAAGGPAAVYGPAPLIDYMFAHKVIAYGWQSAAMSWSGGKVSPNACLLQRVGKTRPKLAGDYDENVVLKSDFGAWMPPVAAPPKPTPPKPVPAPTPKPPTPAPPAVPTPTQGHPSTPPTPDPVTPEVPVSDQTPTPDPAAQNTGWFGWDLIISFLPAWLKRLLHIGN